MGRGLSKDDNAQRLARKHWLEAVSSYFYVVIALSYGFLDSKKIKLPRLMLSYILQIDPRHRYGHNLHFYYDVWFKCQSSQPFFYW